MAPALRAAVEREADALLDRAAFLIAMLDAADAAQADMEPDAEGEADADEASHQPVSLAPDRLRARRARAAVAAS